MTNPEAAAFLLPLIALIVMAAIVWHLDRPYREMDRHLTEALEKFRQQGGRLW